MDIALAKNDRHFTFYKNYVEKGRSDTIGPSFVFIAIQENLCSHMYYRIVSQVEIACHTVILTPVRIYIRVPPLFTPPLQTYTVGCEAVW